MSNFDPTYNYSDGDIVLSSSDNVLFRVHSLVLKLASNFFRQMLEIPRVETESPDDPLPLSEDGTMVGLLLDCIYPHYDGFGAKIRTYDEAWAFTRAAEKYDIPSARQAMQTTISEQPNLQSDAIQLYALACHWGFADVIKFAAERAVKCDVTTELCGETPVLKGLSDKDALNLLRFRRKRMDALLKALYERVWGEYRRLNDAEWVCPSSHAGYPADEVDNAIISMIMAIRGALELGTVDSILLRDHCIWDRSALAIWGYECKDCGIGVANAQNVIVTIKSILRDIEVQISWDKFVKL